MNIKLVKLRITNKRLKSDLKECKHNLLYENAHSKLVGSLENAYENKQNENEHRRKLNNEFSQMYVDLCQETSVIEKDLAVYKKRLVESESIAADYNSLIKDYKENIRRLSFEVVLLTKKIETYKDVSFANKIKNIFRKK